MSELCTIETANLRLVLRTPEETKARIEALQPAEKAQLSPVWLALPYASDSADPWIHSFAFVHRTSGDVVGEGGFKGPPTEDEVVEIAYGIAPEHQGKGYATEGAEALTTHAFASGKVRLVRAHTLPEPNASTRVLTKCGFERVGEVIDPEDGLVWRWEKAKEVC